MLNIPQFERKLMFRLLFQNRHLLDDNRLNRYILILGIIGRGGFADALYYIHAAGYFTEYRIASTLHGIVFAVEKIVIGYVDKKLAGRGIR